MVMMLSEKQLGDEENHTEVNVVFSANFSSNDHILLEVDHCIVDELLSERNLYIRGWKTDEIVLCTQASTNSCREVEISNSLMLLDDICPPSLAGKADSLDMMEKELGVKPKLSIGSVTKSFLEISESSPNVSARIKELLVGCKIDLKLSNGSQMFNTENKGISWNSLLSQVQMSEERLTKELAKYPLVKCDGQFYLLSQETIWAMLDFVVDLCCDQSETNENLSMELLRCKLPEFFPIDAIQWFRNEFCTKNDNATQFSLDETKVSQSRVEQLLLISTKDQIGFDTFAQQVENMLPNKFQFREEHLTGLALVSNSHFYGKTIRRLLPSSLPADLHKRFSLLFSIKPSWKKEEIKPYVMEYCPNSAKLEEFLLKYCRLTGTTSDRHFVYKQLSY